MCAPRSALLVLQQSSIFRGVDSATLEDISKLASTHTYKPGETIFREGEAGNTLHGIVAGQIRITTTSADGQELLLNVIGPGQIVGEIAFLDGGDRTATGTAAVETPCLVDANGVQPTTVTGIPPQLVALIRSQINVQELTVRALVDEAPEHIYHAAMMDPHTAAELDLRQIRSMVDDLLAEHGGWLPEWARLRKAG